MAKSIIKSKHGRGYGLVNEDGSVTPISLEESQLIQSKHGRGLGLSVGGAVVPVSVDGLSSDDINILKKKEDTELSGETSSTVSTSNKPTAAPTEQNPRQIFGMSYADWGKKWGAVGEFASDLLDVPVYIKNEAVKGFYKGGLQDEMSLASNARQQADFDKIVRYNKEVRKLSLPEAQQKKVDEENWGISNFVKSIVGNFVNSMASEVGAYKSGGTGAVAGAATGAAVGAVFPVAEVITAPSGFFGGYGAAASLATEMGAAIEKSMTDRGVDMEDPEQIKKAWNDKELMAEARTNGIQRGIPIAMIDLISAGIGGKLASAGLKTAEKQLLKYTGKELTQKAAKNALKGIAAGTEAISGSLGEAVAQLSDEGKISDWDAVAMEAIVELGAGAPVAAVNYYKAAQINEKENGANNEKINSLKNELSTMADDNEIKPIIENRINQLEKENNNRNRILVDAMENAPVPANKRLLELTDTIWGLEDKLEQLKASGEDTDGTREARRVYNDMLNDAVAERDDLRSQLTEAQISQEQIMGKPSEPMPIGNKIGTDIEIVNTQDVEPNIGFEVDTEKPFETTQIEGGKPITITNTETNTTQEATQIAVEQGGKKVSTLLKTETNGKESFMIPETGRSYPSEQEALGALKEVFSGKRLSMEEKTGVKRTKVAKGFTTQDVQVGREGQKMPLADKVKMKILKATQALQSISGTNVYLYDNEADYIKGVRLDSNNQTDSDEKIASTSATSVTNGDIHINLNNYNPTSLSHEIFHSALASVAKTNAKAFIDMKDKIINRLSKENLIPVIQDGERKEVSAQEYLTAFENRYKDISTEAKAEEFLSELAGLLSHNEDLLNNKTFMESVKLAIRSMLKAVGVNTDSLDTLNDEVELADFFKEFNASLKTGQKINLEKIQKKYGTRESKVSAEKPEGKESKPATKGKPKRSKEKATSKDVADTTLAEYKKANRGNRTPRKELPIKKDVFREALSIQTNNPYDMALQFFIGGGKVLTKDTSDAVKYGKKPKEGILSFFSGSLGEFRKRRRIWASAEKGGLSLDEIAHVLWERAEGYTNNLDTSDFKNAVEEALLNFNSDSQMAAYLADKYAVEIQDRATFNEVVSNEKATDEAFNDVFDGWFDEDPNAPTFEQMFGDEKLMSEIDDAKEQVLDILDNIEEYPEAADFLEPTQEEIDAMNEMASKQDMSLDDLKNEKQGYEKEQNKLNNERNNILRALKDAGLENQLDISGFAPVQEMLFPTDFAPMFTKLREVDDAIANNKSQIANVNTLIDYKERGTVEMTFDDSNKPNKIELTQEQKEFNEKVSKKLNSHLSELEALTRDELDDRYNSNKKQSEKLKLELIRIEEQLNSAITRINLDEADSISSKKAEMESIIYDLDKENELIDIFNLKDKKESTKVDIVYATSLARFMTMEDIKNGSGSLEELRAIELKKKFIEKLSGLSFENKLKEVALFYFDSPKGYNIEGLILSINKLLERNNFDIDSSMTDLNQVSEKLNENPLANADKINNVEMAGAVLRAMKDGADFGDNIITEPISNKPETIQYEQPKPLTPDEAKRNKLQKDLAAAQKDLDYAIGEVEKANEDIADYTSNYEEDKKELQDKLKNLANEKLNKDELSERKEEIKWELEELKDDLDANLEYAKQTLAEAKKDERKYSKQVAKIQSELDAISKVKSFKEKATSQESISLDVDLESKKRYLSSIESAKLQIKEANSEIERLEEKNKYEQSQIDSINRDIASQKEYGRFEDMGKILLNQIADKYQKSIDSHYDAINRNKKLIKKQKSIISKLEKGIKANQKNLKFQIAEGGMTFAGFETGMAFNEDRTPKYQMNGLYNNPDDMLAYFADATNVNTAARQLGLVGRTSRALANNIITRAASKVTAKGFVAINKVGEAPIYSFKQLNPDGTTTDKTVSLNSAWKTVFGYPYNAIRRMLIKSLNSQNRVAQFVQNDLASFVPNLTATESFQQGRRELKGYQDNSNNLISRISRNLNALISGDTEALRRVHSLLDPEAFESLPMDGLPSSVMDLSVSELRLFNTLRAMNDFIHEWHYQNGFIDEATYNKFKGKYFARMYAEIENKKFKDIYDAIEKTGAGADLSIFKARKDFGDVSDSLNLLEDPIYITCKRMATMAHNKAVIDFANQVAASNEYTVYDKMADVPEKLRRYYRELKPYGGDKRFGDLTGKVVPLQIYEQLYGTQFATKFMSIIHDEGLKRYDKWIIRQFLSKSKTVFSPLTRAANITTGFAFAMLGGVDPITMLKNKPAARQAIADYSSYAQDLTKAGLMGNTIRGLDLKQIEELSLTGRIITKVAGQKTFQAISNFDKLVTDSYSKADDVTKLAYYISLVEDYGYSKDKAIRMTAESMQNYNTVGKSFIAASKTPVWGNKFIRFKADSARIFYNMMKERPIYGAMFAAAMIAMTSMFSKLSGESEEEKEAREKRPYQSKLDLGIAEIPFGLKIGDTEYNVARYLSPYSVYDKGYNGNTLTELSEYSPYQLQYVGKKGGKMGGLFGYIPAMQDPALGPLAQIAFDTDFRGLSISDPKANEYRTTTVTDEQARYNRIKFLAYSYGSPYSQWVGSLYNAFSEDADAYGRRRNPYEAMLSLVIKNEKMDSGVLIKKYEGQLRAIDADFKEINKNISGKRNETGRAVGEIEDLYNEGKISKEARDKQIAAKDKELDEFILQMENESMKSIEKYDDTDAILKKLDKVKQKKK